MKKVLFTATVDSHILHFHIPYLKYFKEKGYEVHVATNGNAEIPYCDKKHVISFERSPFKLNNLKAIRQLKKVIDTEKFDIIHTHTPMGSVVTRIAAMKSRKKNKTRVIYTAHGFHFYKGASKKNWLLFYPIEKLLSRVTDTLITINKEDYELAKNKFKCRVEYVAGVGIDPDKFNFNMSDEEKTALRKSLGLKKSDFVMIYPAELSKRKRQIWLINTITNLLKENQPIHLLLPGKDSLNGKCQELVKYLKLTDQIHFLGYRKDIPQLLNISNLALSTASQEGLPVNLMEAMYVGLPIVASDCRGNRDLVINNESGFLIDINDKQQFSKKIEYVYNKGNILVSKKTGKNIINNYLLSVVSERMNCIYKEQKQISNEGKISIIIPIHNSEKFLNKCLQSVVSQIYKNLEIILVDDDSTDSSLAICNEYSKLDKRIKMICSKNNNVSKTRNDGLKYATGEYIAFVDSDDYIEIDMYDVMVKEIIREKVDIVACNFFFETENGTVYKNSKNKEEVLSRNSYPSSIYNNIGMQGYIWNKLYSRDIIYHLSDYIKFDENFKMMEDDLYNYRIFDENLSFKYKVLNSKLYHYVNHSTGASKQKYNEEKMKLFQVKIKEIDLLEKNGLESDYLKADYVIIFRRDQYLMKKNNIDFNKTYSEAYSKYLKFKNEVKISKLSFELIIKFIIGCYLPIIYHWWLIAKHKI